MYMDDGLPPPAADLLKELRSCALDAELRHVCGSWGLNMREEHLSRTTNRMPVSRKFRSIREGGIFQKGHLARLQQIYPRSHLTVWQEHALGIVLTDPRLPQEALVKLLRTLKIQAVRDCALFEMTSSTGVKTAVPRLWDIQLIRELVALANLEALFALVCGMRIAQLNLNYHDDRAAEIALIEMLPIVVGRSRHLILGSYALYAAVQFFLDWEPAREYRTIRSCGIRDDTYLDQAKEGLKSVRLRAVKLDRVAEDLLKRREAYTEEIVKQRRQRGLRY